METVLNKLQEGVKYPRFERDATRIINDLVTHVTQERGIYSSDIEPNPNEHSIWFNTNNNTLYIYNKGVWKTINDKNTDILYTPFVFYCSSGTLYYAGDNVASGIDGIGVSGFYTKERLKYIIDNKEDDPTANVYIRQIYIEPEDDATIIIGEDKFTADITILGRDLNNANIHIYNNELYIGNVGDINVTDDNICWYDATVYCNSKHIGYIKVTHSDSDLDLYITTINFIIGNNNTLTIDQSVANGMDEGYIYVIKETDDDQSKIVLPDTLYGDLYEYVNLCGTKLTGTSAGEIPCYKYITTTIDDIDRPNSMDSPIYMESVNILIIDAHYREFTYTDYLQYIRDYCQQLKIYVTDAQLFDFLKSQGLAPIMAIENNRYFDDKVIVNYKTTDGTDIYNNTIYKH